MRGAGQDDLICHPRFLNIFIKDTCIKAALNEIEFLRIEECNKECI